MNRLRILILAALLPCAALGQPVIVENRPGAGGTIGIGALAKSPADGYTLAVVSTGHVVKPVLFGNELMFMSPAEFDAFLKEEYGVLGEVMRTSGVKAQ